MLPYVLLGSTLFMCLNLKDLSSSSVLSFLAVGSVLSFLAGERAGNGEDRKRSISLKAACQRSGGLHHCAAFFMLRLVGHIRQNGVLLRK